MAENIKDELDESFTRMQLIRRNTDAAINQILETNPLEIVLKNIEGHEDKIDEKEIQERLQKEMQTWLRTYEDALAEGQSVPADLMGRAGELAKEQRKNKDKSVGE